MHAYSETNISNAIAEYSKNISMKELSRKYGIPLTTLRRRLRGGVDIRTANECHQRLSPAHEERIALWVTTQERLGYAPSHASVRYIASQILRQTGDPKPLGVNWMTGFLERNPTIRTKKGIRMERARINGATPNAISEFFNYYKEFTWIKPENIYNVDETGIMEGYGRDGLVLGSAALNPNRTYIKSNQARYWTTIIECVSAVGKPVKPVVIFKGQSVQQQWFSTNFNEDWAFTTSENGWTSNLIAFTWLQSVFIPETAPHDASDARLLVLDGHGSHSSPEFMWECFQNNIFLLFLSPHASHVLQPLDVSVFSPLKKAYQKHLGPVDMRQDSTPIGKLEFLNCYAAARKDAMTVQNIKSGFRGTGIWPISLRKALSNPQIIQITTADDDRMKILETRKKRKCISEYTFKTPQKGSDVLVSLKSIDFSAFHSNKRLMISYSRSIAKCIDQKTFDITLRDEEILQKTLQIKSLHPQKRRKVAINSNELFCSIVDIKSTQNREEIQIAEQIAQQLAHS